MKYFFTTALASLLGTTLLVAPAFADDDEPPVNEQITDAVTQVDNDDVESSDSIENFDEDDEDPFTDAGAEVDDPDDDDG